MSEKEKEERVQVDMQVCPILMINQCFCNILMAESAEVAQNNESSSFYVEV